MFLTNHRFGVELHNSLGVLMLDLAQIHIQQVKIAAEVSIELPSRFAGFLDDWIFHGVNV
jgi:hypothetical protein